MTTINYIHNVSAFPQIDAPPIGTPQPEAYSERQWIELARLQRREMREGLQSGRFYPSDDFMEALNQLERMLEEVKHVR